ncbi:hypothetical protein [Alkalihalobacillus pseudalcaliphilus]|uniref:hypothetical protein n=1 Tax=Alkalihalobacillus pseudalcaliphilus TaxID=79884 RepID=UPI000B195898|nr:hypothetical protein [Alkalihalobacillus pseudalcaliphilus]
MTQTTLTLTVKIEGKPTEARLAEIAGGVADHLLATHKTVARVELTKVTKEDAE